jgi:hypothetical protein
VLVLGLTVGDYLLWNWSLNANHDVVALVSGLTLPPLALVSMWLLALAGARLLSTLGHRRGATVAKPRRRRRVRRVHARPSAEVSAAAARATAADTASRKIAA